MNQKFTYSKQLINSIIKIICDKYKIKIHFYDTNKISNDTAYFKNFSCCCSDDEIEIGYYDDIEKMFISFFHEFAHLRLANKIPGKVEGFDCSDAPSIQYEIWLTMLGVEFAKSNFHIHFSDESVSWMINENLSYQYDCGSFKNTIVEKDTEHYIINRESI